MPKRARQPGLHESELPSCTFKEWQTEISEKWFASDTAFQKFVLHRPVLDPHGDCVSLTVRAIAIFMRFGIAFQIKKCTRCGKEASFEERTSRGWTTYGYTCKRVGHKHMELNLNKFGFLTKVPVNSWMPFLHFMNLLRLGRSYKAIIQELQAGYGNICVATLRRWRAIYQEALGGALHEMGALKVGGRNEVVVLDECIVGIHPEDGWALGSKGINKAGAEQNRKSERKDVNKLVHHGAMKRLPARTLLPGEKAVSSSSILIKKKPASVSRVQKKPSSVLKKPAKAHPAKIAKKPSANLKKNGKWLWVAVVVGKGKAVFTHANRKKRVTYRLLPRSSQASQGKPRGFQEMSATVQSRVVKGSYLVFDGWAATNKAVNALGYKCAPPVNHEKWFRDRVTGFHTNDAESENSRLKAWSRARYGKLHIDAHEMDEYVFYINVGDNMLDVFRGLAMSNGGPCANNLMSINV